MENLNILKDIKNLQQYVKNLQQYELENADNSDNECESLLVEEYNETSSKFPNIPLYLYFYKGSLSPIKCPK